MGWRLLRTLRPLPARGMGSHSDHRREMATAPAPSLRVIPGLVCLFFPGPATEKVDRPGLRHWARAMDSRQILVVDFSAARFWLATGPVCFPVSDFLLSLADSVSAIAD